MATPPTQPSSRSPSPSPAPPTASAPGPRASALLKLYNDAIAHILKTCNYLNFASCFPTLARAVPGSLKALHEDFTTQLGASLHKDFEAVLAERKVVERLNGLDGVIEEARREMRRAAVGEREERVAPHTLPPQHLYLAHLLPRLTEYSADIRTRQQAVQDENLEVLSRVQQQRREIAALVAGLESAVADLDAGVAALDAEEIEALREEVRDVDEGMRMEV